MCASRAALRPMLRMRCVVFLDMPALLCRRRPACAQCSVTDWAQRSAGLLEYFVPSCRSACWIFQAAAGEMTCAVAAEDGLETLHGTCHVYRAAQDQE